MREDLLIISGTVIPCLPRRSWWRQVCRWIRARLWN
jgi:hypothetical protein